MRRREFLAGSIAAAGFAAGPADRANVIWIFGDQHRGQAMGCAGDPNVATPNLDAMAAQGVRFTGAVSGMPLCCPARGSFLTSLYPHQCVPGHEYPLPVGQKTIANVFNDAGYATAYFGKWHLAGFHESEGRSAMRIVPPDRRGGFQTWVGYDNNNSQYDCWVHGGAGKDAFQYRLPGYETDELSNLLIRYIKDQRKEKPFFAALSVQPPHDPYVAPAEFMQRHTPGRIELRQNVPNVASVMEPARRWLAGYYAQIENLDWNIGRIRRAIDEAGLGFNTHLIFFSDHGDMQGSQGQFKKMTPYEESIRIPFIIGGGQPQGYEGWGMGHYGVPLNHVDIPATTLGLCGIAKPQWMRGTDYSHYRVHRARGTAAEPDSAYLQSVVPTGHGDSVDKPWRGVVTKDGWKYVCFEGISWLMFHLEEDPYEQVNLAHNSKYRAERGRLLARLRQWVADTGDHFPVPQA
jgi:arylsulfatase A-like enzyme